ncbi:allergen Tha p 1-like [Plodia interpunctella]|uniref:allergen Tha p 1-like n=1 Tax=Plodia interpunctella TaxID=58824 RepID=UPI0023685331|nr:allergen Tha p 1-like [Plodia interpunctella]XP_053614223.1 allergen Tha p 1-like [Plodia interpunctella]
MHVLILLLALPISFVLAQDETYNTRYDSLKLQEVLQNRRLTMSYVKCILDKGRCTAEGRELKSHISEALQNGCAKCTGAQFKGAKQVIKHLINHEPKSWKELVKKYDPERVYMQKYEHELKNL